MVYYTIQPNIFPPPDKDPPPGAGNGKIKTACPYRAGGYDLFLRYLFFAPLQITGCGIVDKPSILRKAGAVTRAVPRVLLLVPFKRAAEVRAPLR